MKKFFKPFVIAIALGMAFVGCQKDTMSDISTEMQEATIRSVTYSVDGVYYQIVVNGEQEWLDFMDRMFALARNGHQVSVRDNNASSSSVVGKEVIVYTTNNSADANEWSQKMINNGYDVTIEYNSRTGIYTCTAVK